jgi:hypothetical protein
VALEPREQAEVLRDRELAVERRLLWDPPDLSTRARDRAGVGALRPREDREERRLAGAVGADHRDQLAAPGLDRHRAQRHPLSEGLDEVAGLEDGGRRARVCRLRGCGRALHAATVPSALKESAP